MVNEPEHRPTPSREGPEGEEATAFTIDPRRLLRIAAVTKEVLEETRRIRPKPEAIDHLRRVHGQICNELREALPPKLYDELSHLTPDVNDDSMEELALAHAEILGWLEGLFQGAQLALQARSAATTSERSEPPTPEPQGPPGSEPPDPRYL